MKYLTTQSRIFIALSVSVILLLSGCNKIDKLTHFNMDYETEFVISSAIGINLPFNIYSPNITTNSESIFELNDTKADKVEHISIHSLALSISSPSGKNFNFLKDINLYISADGLPEIKIAWLLNHNDNDANNLSLEVAEELDLQEYVKGESFSLRSETVTDQILTSDINVMAKLTYWVDARVLGL